MEKLTPKKVNQFEALRIVNDKMGRLYADFLTSGACSQLVNFKIYFFIKVGSIEADVYFEEVVKPK